MLLSLAPPRPVKKEYTTKVSAKIALTPISDIPSILTRTAKQSLKVELENSQNVRMLMVNSMLIKNAAQDRWNLASANQMVVNAT